MVGRRDRFYKACTIYRPMLSIGTFLADYAPAPEDVAEVMEAATVNVGEAKSVASQALTQSNTAISDSATATTTANTAATNASTALKNATSAITTANTANSAISALTSSGTVRLKLNANGLLQSFNSGSTYYRVNPVVLIIKLKYNSSFGYETVYNPLGKSVSATRTGDGQYSIYHYLNHTYYTLSGSGHTETSGNLYMTVIGRYSTYTTIQTSDDSSCNELAEFIVTFFDYKSY